MFRELCPRYILKLSAKTKKLISLIFFEYNYKGKQQHLPKMIYLEYTYVFLPKALHS